MTIPTILVEVVIVIVLLMVIIGKNNDIELNFTDDSKHESRWRLIVLARMQSKLSHETRTNPVVSYTGLILAQV